MARFHFIESFNFVMPEDKNSEFMTSQQQRAVSAATDEERVEALRRLFCGVLARCAEEAIDAELPAIEGTPTESKFPLRSDSAYYPYQLARQKGFVGFTDEQRKIVKGLVMHTAFEVMDNVFHQLDNFPGFQIGISLYPCITDPAIEHRLRSLESDDLALARTDIPEALTKHEY
jgi:hypothetical protein